MDKLQSKYVQIGKERFPIGVMRLFRVVPDRAFDSQLFPEYFIAAGNIQGNVFASYPSRVVRAESSKGMKAKVDKKKDGVREVKFDMAPTNKVKLEVKRGYRLVYLGIQKDLRVDRIRKMTIVY